MLNVVFLTREKVQATRPYRLTQPWMEQHSQHSPAPTDISKGRYSILWECQGISQEMMNDFANINFI